MSGKDSLDFTEFDAEASDLHLIIGTTEKLPCPIRVLLSEIAALVDAHGWNRSGSGQEGGTFVRSGIVQITTRNRPPTEIQFARLTGGDGLAFGAEKQGLNGFLQWYGRAEAAGAKYQARRSAR